MTQNIDKKYKSVPKREIDELAAIYDDYLFIARQHENVFKRTSVKRLEEEQREKMHHDAWDGLAWKVTSLSLAEKQEYEDFINDDMCEDDSKTYIILRHIKPEEDNGYSKVFAIPPYKSTSINMQLPSSLERCSVIYSENRTLGNTVFFVDGQYKAVYTGKRDRNKPLPEYVLDEDMMGEFYVLLNLIDPLKKNDYVHDDKYESTLRDFYAGERVFINESIILELLGSFADKIIDICHILYIGYKDDYTFEENIEALNQAEKEGLIVSADDFLDYVNLRHFLRHQWDSLDGLGYFNPRKAQENKEKRDRYVASYLKICDKPIVQRAKSYIDILHQMQHIINTLCPDRIIRYEEESNGKFMERIKAAHSVNPDISIELNSPLSNNKYISLSQRIPKLFPNIKIADLYPRGSERFTQINDYVLRTYFLQTFVTTECMVMRHAQIRGYDLKNTKAWKYMEEIGLLSHEEIETWRKYARLRNSLSHDYFNDKLRKKLSDYEEEYKKNVQIMRDRFEEYGPNVQKLRQNVYEYRHVDGLVVRLDRKHHRVLYSGTPEDSKKNSDTSENTAVKQERQLADEQYDVCPGGVVFITSGNTITSVELPNDVTIHFDTQSIDWDHDTHWTTNENNFSVLQTAKSKIVVNGCLFVTEYLEKNCSINVGNCDKRLIDNRHIVSFNDKHKIQDFIFRNKNNQTIRTRFMLTPEGYRMLIFSDGTMVLSSGQQMVVRHGGKTLTFDDRHEFAATYAKPQTIIQQVANQQNVH